MHIKKCVREHRHIHTRIQAHTDKIVVYGAHSGDNARSAVAHLRGEVGVMMVIHAISHSHHVRLCVGVQMKNYRDRVKMWLLCTRRCQRMCVCVCAFVRVYVLVCEYASGLYVYKGKIYARTVVRKDWRSQLFIPPATQHGNQLEWRSCTHGCGCRQWLRNIVSGWWRG